MKLYAVVTNNGSCHWYAESADHAVAQHAEQFPDEVFYGVCRALDT